MYTILSFPRSSQFLWSFQPSCSCQFLSSQIPWSWKIQGILPSLPNFADMPNFPAILGHPRFPDSSNFPILPVCPEVLPERRVGFVWDEDWQEGNEPQWLTYKAQAASGWSSLRQTLPSMALCPPDRVANNLSWQVAATGPHCQQLNNDTSWHIHTCQPSPFDTTNVIIKDIFFMHGAFEWW